MREFHFRTIVRLVIDERLSAHNYDQAREMHDSRVNTTLAPARKAADEIHLLTEDGEYRNGRLGPVREKMPSLVCELEGYDEGDVPPGADMGEGD